MGDTFQTVQGCEKLHDSMKENMNSKFDGVNEKLSEHHAQYDKMDDVIRLMASTLTEIKVLTSVVTRTSEENSKQIIQHATALALIMEEQKAKKIEYEKLRGRVDNMEKSSGQQFTDLIKENSISIPESIKYILGVLATVLITSGITYLFMRGGK